MIKIQKGQLVICRHDSAITDNKELGFCYDVNKKGCSVIFEYGGDSRCMIRDVEEFILPLNYINETVKSYNFKGFPQLWSDYESAYFNEAFKEAREIFFISGKLNDDLICLKELV